jgi:hypothetical protein
MSNEDRSVDHSRVHSRCRSFQIGSHLNFGPVPTFDGHHTVSVREGKTDVTGCRVALGKSSLGGRIRRRKEKNYAQQKKNRSFPGQVTKEMIFQNTGHATKKLKI